MEKRIDVRSTGEHSEWVTVCEKVAEAVDAVDGILVMSSESHFYIDVAEVNPVVVSEQISETLREFGYEEMYVSGTSFSHLEDIADHEETQEIRVKNSITK